MTGVRRAFLIGFVSIAALVAASPALAQSTGPAASPADDGADIVVTAQKRSERLLDVPVPVTVISGESLTLGNQLRVQDYFNQIPGLNLAVTGNGNAAVINIRGVTTGGSTSPTVGIVVDDVPYGATVNPGNIPVIPDIDPGDLARVEVLRGPQGTLYGAASMGGLLKFVTVDPSTTTFSGRVQAGLSSVADGEIGYNARASLNIPVSSTLALRASGFATRIGGYIDNIQTGGDDVDRTESWGGRASILWRPSADFSLKLGALYQKSDRNGGSFLDLNLIGKPAQNTLIGTGVNNSSTQAYSAQANLRLGSVDLVSVTGYNVDRVLSAIDFSPFLAPVTQAFYGVSGAAAPLGIRIKKLTQEVRASVPISSGITWLIGGFYTREEARSHLDLHAVNPSSGARAGDLAFNDQPTTFRELAAFTNVTVELGDRFDIQVGGRYSTNRQTFSTTRSGPLAAALFGANNLNIAGITSKDHSTTFLVTPRFKISKDAMLYARVASGYRPGGPNTLCGVTPCTYGPDTTLNYELGFKTSLFDKRLTLDASVYLIDWKDIQLPLAVTVAGVNSSYVGNGSRARSQGFELSMEAHPVEGLTLSGWFAYNDAKLTRGLPAASPNVGLRGDRLPYSSPYSGNFSFNHALPLADRVTANWGLSLSYVGARRGLFAAAGQPRPVYPDYAELNLHAGVDVEGWSLNLFANNVTNERGVLRSGADSTLANFITYTQPRTIGVNLAKKF